MRSRMIWLAALVMATAVVGATPPIGAQVETPRAALVDGATTRIVMPGDSPGDRNTPQYLAVSPGAVWVAQHRSGEVDRIDPATNQVNARVRLAVPGCLPTGCMGLGAIVADRRSVWVVNNEELSLVHIDARTNEVVGEMPTMGMGPPPVIDGDTLWVALSASGAIMRIDARTHEVVRTVRVGVPRVWPLAIVGRTLWASSYDATAPPDRASTLYRIDRVRGKVTAEVPGIGADLALVVDGDLWLYGCGFVGQPQLRTACPTVKRVDGRTGAVEAEVRVDGVPFDAARADDGTAFFRSSTGAPGPQWITRVDTTENRAVTRYDLGPMMFGQSGIVTGHGSLWVGDWDTNTVYRVALAP